MKSTEQGELFNIPHEKVHPADGLPAGRVTLTLHTDGRVQIEIGQVGQRQRARGRHAIAQCHPTDRSSTMAEDESLAVAEFFEEWRHGKLKLPFCITAARDLFRAYLIWRPLGTGVRSRSKTTFGTVISHKLKQLGARQKQKTRYSAWSEDEIRTGAFGRSPHALQGVVYFPPSADRTGVDLPSVSADVQRFQRALHSLLNGGGSK